MTMKPVALICVLLLLELSLADKDKTYNFLFTPACNVNEELKTGFTVKNYKQPEACPSPDTVCVSIPGTIVEFSGKFPEPGNWFFITISGEGKTAELPITFVSLSRKMVAEFPVSGTLPFLEKQDFNVNGMVVYDIGQIGGNPRNFIRRQSGDCDPGKLCYAVNINNISGVSVWGTMGDFKAIAMFEMGNDFVVIPLIQMKPNSVTPDPPAIELRRNTLVTSAKVMVPFVVDTVTGDKNVTLQEKSNCQAENACYQIFVPTSATFKGKMPASPVSITVSGDTQTNTYIFDSAGTALRSGLLTLMTASTAFLGARI